MHADGGWRIRCVVRDSACELGRRLCKLESVTYTSWSLNLAEDVVPSFATVKASRVPVCCLRLCRPGGIPRVLQCVQRPWQPQRLGYTVPYSKQTALYARGNSLRCMPLKLYALPLRGCCSPLIQMQQLLWRWNGSDSIVRVHALVTIWPYCLPARHWTEDEVAGKPKHSYLHQSLWDIRERGAKPVVGEEWYCIKALRASG